MSVINWRIRNFLCSVLLKGILISSAVVALVLACPGIASAAAPPRAIFYQGRLTNDTGDLLTGNYTMGFALYDAASGGVKVWDTTGVSVDATNGIFSVYLSGGTTGSLDTLNFDTKYWLELTVSGTAFTPRSALAAAPYAYIAYSVTDSAVDTAAILNAAVTSAKIADGTIANADISATAAIAAAKIDSSPLQWTLVAGDTMTGALTVQPGAGKPSLFARADATWSSGDTATIFIGNQFTNFTNVYGGNFLIDADKVIEMTNFIKIREDSGIGIADTQERIVFNGSADCVEIDSAILYADSRVGIGTRTPEFRLHVQGDGIFVRPDATWSSGDTAAIHLGNPSTAIYNQFGGNLTFNSDNPVAFKKDNDTFLRITTGTGSTGGYILGNNIPPTVYYMFNQNGIGWKNNTGNEDFYPNDFRVFITPENHHPNRKLQIKLVVRGDCDNNMWYVLRDQNNAADATDWRQFSGTLEAWDEIPWKNYTPGGAGGVEFRIMANSGGSGSYVIKVAYVLVRPQLVD